MPKATTRQDVMAAVHTLDIVDRFNALTHRLRQETQIRTVQALLANFKKEAECRYKELALKYHPDRGGNEHMMQTINAAWDVLKSLQIGRAPTAPPPAVVVHINFGGTTASTSTSTSWFSSPFPGVQFHSYHGVGFRSSTTNDE